MDTRVKDEVIPENLVHLQKTSGNQWDLPRVNANSLEPGVAGNSDGRTNSSPDFRDQVQNLLDD